MHERISNELKIIEYSSDPVCISENFIYVTRNDVNNSIYLNATFYKTNIREVIKIDRDTGKISKESFLSPDCLHLETFMSIIGIFRADGFHYLAGVTESECYKIGWATIFKIKKIKVIQVKTCEEKIEFSHLFTTYFQNNFFFSFDIDLTGLNGKYFINYCLYCTKKK